MSDLVTFDYETLGTKESAVVLSMGMAVFKEEWVTPLLNDFTAATCQEYFNIMIKEGLYMKFNAAEQIKKYHRTVDQSTIAWWKTQGDSASIVMKPSAEDISISEMEGRIAEWRGERKKGVFFTRGMIDSRWYEDIMNSNFKSGDNPFTNEIPWPKCRDVRTTIDELLQEDGKGSLPNTLKYLVDFPNFIKHNALHDSAIDCLNVVIARILCFANPLEITDDDIPF